MPELNHDFGPRWIAENRHGTVRPAHAKDDAEAFERGYITATELERCNEMIEAGDLAAFYHANQ